MLLLDAATGRVLGDRFLGWEAAALLIILARLYHLLLHLLLHSFLHLICKQQIL